jgi:hypothetical protein
VETVARDGKYLFQRFCPFIAFEVIQNNMQVCVNARKNYKIYVGKN